MTRSTKDDGTDRVLTQEGSRDTHDLEAESSLYDTVDDLYSQRYEALQGERMAAAKAAARHTYEILRYAEDWHIEDRTGPKQEVADSRTILRALSR